MPKVNQWFVKSFEKYAKIITCSQFPQEIFWKFSRFSQTFQRIVFFFQSRKKLTNGLLNSFQTYAKIMHFLQFSSENFPKISQKFPANSVFRPNAQKLNAGFVRFFEKYAQKSIFSNFLNKIFIIFLKFVWKFRKIF